MEKPTEEAPKEEKKKESRKEKESLALRILNSKVMIWATIIGTILGIIGFLQALVSERNKSELSVSLNYHNREMIVGQSDTLLPLVKPEEGIYEYIWKSDNETAVMVSSTGVVRLLEVGSATVTLVVKDKKGETVQASCMYIVRPEGTVIAEDKPVEKEVPAKSVPDEANTVKSTPVQETPAQKPKKPASSSSSLNLGYASYEGDLRDGQPHGNGILTFSCHHLIPGTVDCNANAGEKVIGAFRDGKVNMGTWYRNDGTQYFYFDNLKLIYRDR